MDTPATSLHNVPIWVWGLVGVVVLFALLSHNSSVSAAATPTLTDSGPSDASVQLQAAQLGAQTTLASKLLDIVGTEDIANIQARSQEVYGNQQIAALNAEANIAGASQPQSPINVTVNQPSMTPSKASTAAVLAAAATRNSVVQSINRVAGAFGAGVRYAHDSLL